MFSNATVSNADAPSAEVVVAAIQSAPPTQNVVTGAPTQAAFTALAMAGPRVRCWSKQVCDSIVEILKESGIARLKKFRSIVKGYTDVNGVMVPPVKLPWTNWDATSKKISCCMVNDNGTLFVVEGDVEKEVLCWSVHRPTCVPAS